MNRDTRFSPLFKNPNAPGKKARGPASPDRLPVLKIISIILALVLVTEIYHNREWFTGIPSRAEAPLPDTLASKVTPVAVDSQPQAPAANAPVPTFAGTEAEAGFFRRLLSFFSSKPTPVQDENVVLDARLDSLYASLAFDRNAVTRTIRNLPDYYFEERVTVPRGHPLTPVVFAVQRLLESNGYSVPDIVTDDRDSTVTMQVENAGQKQFRKILFASSRNYLPGTARAALVLEGFGPILTENLAALFTGLNRPVTVGIVPLTPFSGRYRELAQKKGWEILCQIPMEPEPYRFVGEIAVYKHYQEEKLERVIADIEKDVPDAAGFSIYGSGNRITENEPDILRWLLRRLEKDNRYFLDNSFAGHSRTEELSRTEDLPYLAPFKYIDREKELADQKETLAQYAAIIRKTGKGVLLVRDCEYAGELIAYAIPYLESYGIKLVTLSTLYK
ncbi:MAG: divergent polysaccharide deacetylase family protein [Fibrobacterota bacterium]